MKITRTMPSTKTCRHCNATDQRGQWWSLSNYYGLSGWFCPKCYGLVEHRSSWNDPVGQPVNPKGYASVIDAFRALEAAHKE